MTRRKKSKVNLFNERSQDYDFNCAEQLYFKCLDVAKLGLTKYIVLSDLKKYQKLANMLFTEVLNEKTMEGYQELSNVI